MSTLAFSVVLNVKTFGESSGRRAIRRFSISEVSARTLKLKESLYMFGQHVEKFGLSQQG
jgi:hypothetical protein